MSSSLSSATVRSSRPLNRLLPNGALLRLSSKDMHQPTTVDNHGWHKGRSFGTEEHRCGMLTSVRESNTRMDETSSKNLSFEYQHKLRQSMSDAQRSGKGRLSSSSSSSSSDVKSLVTAFGGDRFNAVVRCQAEDWQVNELDTFGDVVTLNKRPKGRWTKVDKHKAILVEDDSNERFVDPKKTYTPKMAHAGRYAPVLGQLPKGTPVLNFNVYRHHHSLPTVLERMRYATRVSSEAIAFAGDEEYSGVSYMDGFGTVTQQGKVLGITQEFLPQASRHYGLFPLIFDPKHYEALRAPRGSGEASVFKTDTQGSLYRVVLRCTGLKNPAEGPNEDGSTNVDKFYGWGSSSSSSSSGLASSSASAQPTLAERAKAIEREGFLNYYPLSTFSVAANSFHGIAAAVGSGNYNRACSAYLQSYAESNPLFYDEYVRYVSCDESVAPTILRELSRAAKLIRGHHTLVNFLSDLENVTDFSTNSIQLQSLWERWVFQRPKYAHAAVAFIWNAMASQRVLSAGARHIIVGDLVYVTQEEYRTVAALTKDSKVLRTKYSPATVEGVFAPSDATFYITRVETEAQARETSISRLVLPVCDHRNPDALKFPSSFATEELHRALAKQQGLDFVLNESKRSIFEQMTRGGTRRLVSSPHNLPLYRTVVAFPSHVELHSTRDPNSVAALKTDLFLMQERKPLFPSLLPKSRYDKMGNENPQRIREPAPFNVSPRFTEQMKPIISHARNIDPENENTTFIGARLPRNSHMSLLLREHFDVRHGRFHDMLW